jgi:linoleoyl-CoA desaturase
MQTIKFINKDKGQFTATLRKNVNEHFKTKGVSTKGNWKMLLKSAVMISLYLIPFILILTLPMSGWLMFPLSVVMGIGMAGIGMGVMHDAVHGSFSNKGWVNKLFGNTIYLLGGNKFNWKIQHNVLHHTYTNIEGHDEDIDPKAVFRMSKRSPLKKIHRFQHLYAFFFYSLMTLSRFTNEFKQLAKYNKKGITAQQGADPRREFNKLVLGKVLYFMIGLALPLIVSPFSWWLVLLGFLTMHLVAGLFMSVVFQMAHVVEEADQPVPSHEGIIENEWTIHELETTANFARKSRVFGYFIGGLNFQVEHHLFPNICHVHYPEISPIVERTAREFGLRYNENRTFFGAIGSHLRMMRALGR